MSSPPPGIPGSRVLQEIGALTVKLSVAQEQIEALQQQNANLAKQLREVLEENAKLKASTHVEVEAQASQPATN